jgi:hypothetical protein
MTVQNTALWVLIVVCVDSLWTGYNETWILCSLNPHFFLNQSYQNFHKNIENDFVFPTHILIYVLKQQKLACCSYFKFLQLEIGGWGDDFHL